MDLQLRALGPRHVLVAAPLLASPPAPAVLFEASSARADYQMRRLILDCNAITV